MPLRHISSPCASARPVERIRLSLTWWQPDELYTWLRETRDHLSCKMQRERAYLDRRRTRGIYTPTDEDFEADQILEANLLDLLDEMAAKLEESS